MVHDARSAADAEAAWEALADETILLVLTPEAHDALAPRLAERRVVWRGGPLVTTTTEPLHDALLEQAHADAARILALADERAARIAADAEEKADKLFD